MTDLLEFLLSEANQPFTGWDFSWIRDRMVSAPLEWSYTSVLLPYKHEAKSMLDMGTGGGEKLSKLQPLPAHTAATENYAPNVPVAKARLNPLGVEVISFEDDAQLPFDDNLFDLIINRHESYVPSEIERILAPGGVFITQQVGDQNDLAINRMLDAPAPQDEGPWNIGFASAELAETGLEILQAKECFPAHRIFDVGALVYHLKAIPWQVEDFTVEKYYPALEKIHRYILERGYVESVEHRFLIVAIKPTHAQT